MFNPKSQALKKAGIDPASLNEEQMLGLLVEEPRYWRRPVAVIDGKLIAGANAKTLAAELGSVNSLSPWQATPLSLCQG